MEVTVVFCSVTTWSLSHATGVDINQTLSAVGALRKQIDVLKHKKGSVRGAALTASWGVVTLLGLNAEGSHQRVGTSLGA